MVILLARFTVVTREGKGIDDVVSITVSSIYPQPTFFLIEKGKAKKNREKLCFSNGGKFWWIFGSVEGLLGIC